MSRRPATFTQADVARALRAAKQTGAEAVEIRLDSIVVHLKKIASELTSAVAPAHAETVFAERLDRMQNG